MKAPKIAVRPATSFSSQLATRLRDAVEGYALAETPDWSPLDELSSHTLFEGITVDPDSVIEDERGLVAPGRVYVKLQYDPKSDDSLSLNDSYPISVRFHITGDEDPSVQIDGIDVDTASFYE
jgi:hypothetical protein